MICSWKACSVEGKKIYILLKLVILHSKYSYWQTDDQFVFESLNITRNWKYEGGTGVESYL